MTEAGRDIKRQLRKQETRLTVSAYGITIFAIWSVIKMALLVMTGQSFSGTLPSKDSGVGEIVAFVIFALIAALFAYIDVRIRLYLARSARLEADGLKKGRGYLVIASIYAIISLTAMVTASLALLGIHGLSSEEQPLSMLASVVVELTAFLNMFNMVRAAGKVRKLRRMEYAD